MSTTPTALLDANILYSLSLRDVFLQLAYERAYSARWTNGIHEEWIRAVLRNNPNITPETLARLRTKMNSEIPNCLITDYEYIIPALELLDKDDRHVLAAAIRGECDFIITLNLSDFPNDILAWHGIKALSPDDFLTGLVNRVPDAVCLSIRTIRKRLTRPHFSVDEYLDMLEGQSVPKTVTALRKLDPSAL